MDMSPETTGLRELSVEVRDLSVRFGALTVLDRMNLDVREGEFLVLLGPSGCGKSTLLNTIAGLEERSGGQVIIGGRDVSDFEPKDRGISMVFQSYALYPTMTVRENLSFGLQVARLPKPEIERRVARAAETLELTPYLARKPAALSGGQRQRVAIGRALVREVDVFLFDEPLSNLDAQLRAELRVEIKRLHARLGNTMIYVTHDQIEAMTLADRIAVMKGGVIQQHDTPEAIYNRPINTFVARFIGSPPMNFIEGELFDEGGPGFRGGPVRLALPADEWAADPGRRATLGIRPERIVVGPAAESCDFSWDATIELREPLGGETLLWCFLGDLRVCVKCGASVAARAGDHLRAGFNAADVSLFDASSGERIAQQQ